MKKLLMILACCMVFLTMPVTSYAAKNEKADRVATDSNANSGNVKIYEIELSIICTKPNENIVPENIRVDFKTEYCHVKEINITRYNKAEIIIASDDGYVFSNNIDEWAKVFGNGVEIGIIDKGWRESFLEVEVNNAASTEPSEGDTQQVLFDKYFDKINGELQKIREEKINMSDANTVESVRKYLIQKLSKPSTDKIEMDVIVESKTSGAGRFLPAIAGTIDNKTGKNGDCSFDVRIWEKDDKETLEIVSGSAIIKAMEYTSLSSGSNGGSGGGSSSGGGGGRRSSGGSSSNNAPQGLLISKPSIIMGIWEPVDGRWKLKISDGSYASSQWASLDGKWYLLGADGYMLNSWQMVNSKWYLLGPDGAMLTGWQAVDGKWYWLEENGEMITGWEQIGNKWYYLGQDGAMLAGTTTPDGYAVNENGEWIQ